MNPDPLVLSFLAAATARETGQIFGILLVLALATAALIKCIRIMRRPTTSSACVCALLILVINWIGGMVVSAGTKLLHWPPVASILWGLVAMILAVAAITLAIIGLAQFDFARFNQGRAQAIWAIVLSGMILVSGVVGAVASFTQRLNPGLMAGPAQPKILPEHNCGISPPAGWKEIDAQALGNRAAAAAYRRTSPEVFMVLVPEQLGTAMDLENYTSVVASNLSGAAEILEQTDDKVSTHGLDFRRVQSSVRLKLSPLDIYYEHWLTTKGGFFWQLMFWGAVRDRKAVAAEAAKFVETFRILDPKREVSVTGTLVDVDRPIHGYATHLAGQGWNEDRDGTVSADPEVSFAAVRPTEALVVLPIHFGQLAPEMEAVTSGLLGGLGFAWPLQAGVSERKPFPVEHGEGEEFTTTRKIEGHEFNYVIRVVRWEQDAILIAAWAQTEGGDLERARAALERIDLHPPAGEPPPPSAAWKPIREVVFNQAGLFYFKRHDFEPAATWFQRAFAESRSDPVLLDNAANALQNLEKYDEALALVQAEADRFPKVWELQMRKAALLVLTGDPVAGNAHFLSLLDGGLKSEEQLLNWTNFLVGLQHNALAEAAAKAWNARQPTPKTQMWEAQTIVEQTDFPRAIGMLEKLATDNPADESIIGVFGETLNDAGEYSRAAEVAQHFLDSGTESPRILQILGWSQMGRKWFRDAKSTFERAASLRPGDESLAEAVRYASASLGQGNNSSVKQPIEPVPVPDEIAAALKDASESTGKEISDSSAVWIERSTGYQFEEGKPLRRTLRRRVRVLDRAGVDQFSTFDFPFDPLSERIYVNHLEVRDAKGEVQQTASVDDSYVTDLDGPEATHRKVLHVQAPGLQPGFTVDAIVTTEDLAATKEFPFERWLFLQRSPCVAEVVFVRGHTEAVQSALFQNEKVRTVKGKDCVGWMVNGTPGFSIETLTPNFETFTPGVWLGRDGATWENIARDYLADIEDRLRPDQAAVDMATRLCTDLKTDREKIVALGRELQHAIGYQAIEFGVRARRPNAPAATLRTRLGDCKDQALLLHQLLQAAGIRSHLALVNTRWTTEPKLPSLDQFNHMVVHVPALGPDWLVDITDKQLAFENYPASGLWESHALILDPKNPRLLAPSPRPSPGSATITSSRVVSPDGADWRVKESLTFSGYYASWVRGMFEGLSTEDSTRKAQAILAGLGAATLTEFRFENRAELGEPARMNMSYLVRRAIQPRGEMASGRIPAFWEANYLEQSFVQNRQTPALFRFPFEIKSEVTLKLPPDANVPALAQSASDRFVDWKLTPASHPTSEQAPWQISFHFQAHPGSIPARDYAAFHEAWDGARRAWDTPLEWSAP